MKATLQEVAQRAGVSISTVSRALSGRARVDPETRAKIRAAMEELNYPGRGEAEGQAPAPRDTGMIGFMMPEGMQELGLNTTIYGTVIGAVRSAAERSGFALAVGTYTDGPAVLTVGDRMLAQGQIAGAVLYRTRLSDESFARFRDLRIPFVVINRLFERDPVTCVGTDHRRCGELATRHLLELGHRRIAFVNGPASIASFVGRAEGYRQALLTAEGAPGTPWLVDGELDPQQTRAAARALLEAPERPTAIIGANDRTAFAIIEAVRAAGLRVPEDVSVIGFDDAEEAPYVSPPLTTVRVEWAQMADLATLTLVELLRRPMISRSLISLEPTLVVRQSTAPASM